MYIDSTVLMYQVFQRCRHGQSDAAYHLTRLAEVMDEVKRCRCVHVHMTDAWITATFEGEPARLLEQLGVRGKRKPMRDLVLSQDNAALFELLDAGIHDLCRLTAAGETHATQRLGYALHPLPPLLKRPIDFAPGGFAFCRSLLVEHEALLSERLLEALRDVTPDQPSPP